MSHIGEHFSSVQFSRSVVSDSLRPHEPTGMTLRDGTGREVGGRVRMGNTCTPIADSCELWQNPPQHCKVISFQLKLKKKSIVYFKWEDHLAPAKLKHVCLFQCGGYWSWGLSSECQYEGWHHLALQDGILVRQGRSPGCRQPGHFFTVPPNLPPHLGSRISLNLK